MTISPADQFGQPTIGAASALASVNVPFTPTNIPRVYPDLDVHVTAPAMLEAGRQYAIVLTAPNESPSNFIAWAYDAGSSETDSSGTPCADGAYTRGRAWGYGTEVPTPDADFFFSTYMVPIQHLVVQKGGAGDGTVAEAGGKLNCGTTCAADFDRGRRSS